MPIPILFYGDSADIRTGLGRIGRDLATLCSSLPEFRVGYYGLGALGSRQLPFAQYFIHPSQQWGEENLPRVWSDFAGKQKGVIFTIWDASRLHWFSRPHHEMGPLFQFLTAGHFQRWGYFPVDAEGVGGVLTTRSRDALRGYDRILGYGAWGAQVLSRSVQKEVDWIPHGINLQSWKPQDKKAARMAMHLPEDATVIGCNMTNQTRKDWGVAFGCFRLLAAKDPAMRFWIHVDELVRSDRWDLRSLIVDHGLNDRIVMSRCGGLTDEQLSYYYSGCDLTILPSLGEGFGFPIVESLACGVPCVHGKYGGGVELIPRAEWLVEPVPHAFRIEGLNVNVRPTYNPVTYADVCSKVLSEHVPAEECRGAVEHLDWVNLWPSAWKKWFLEGLK